MSGSEIMYLIAVKETDEKNLDNPVFTLEEARAIARYLSRENDCGVAVLKFDINLDEYNPSPVCVFWDGEEFKNVRMK